jgi:hypothetical protein
LVAIDPEESMTESLRDLMIELHGEAGQELYNRTLANRERIAKRAEIEAELAQVRRELSAKIEATRARLRELQDAANLAYSAWLGACNELERGKIEHQQAKAQLRDQTQAIRDEMRGLAPVNCGVNLQWHTPSWVKPESENKGDSGPDSTTLGRHLNGT